ncbi:MAG: flagellar basal-body MS-ring/collar protein FliF [Candidatus Riflemargulisbacteria bacterium]
MSEIIKRFYEQLKVLLNQLNFAQRLTLLMLGIIIFVSFIGIGIWGTRPDFVTLYAGLAEESTGEVVKKLDEKNIPYKIGPNGSSIMVPSKLVRSLRVELATEGIPKGAASGYELFDQFKLGVTEFTQKVNYQRALESELAKTITSISQIRAARVHLVMPEESVFVSDKEKTTASLVLDIVGGSLSQGQINGIVHLVASSVKGLSPKDITIVDTNSNVLYVYEDDGLIDSGLSMRQMNVQKQYEGAMESRIASMLTQIFGSNSSVVRVNVRMNFDKLESESEIFMPADDPILRSARTMEESGNGSNASNMANTDKSNYAKTDETTNYEVSKKIEKFVKAPGYIEKISVAVILDRQITDEQSASLKEAISSAAGIDATRGDAISLSNLTFDKKDMETTKKEMDKQRQTAMIMNILKNVGLGLLLVFTVFYAYTRLKKLQAISGAGGSWGVNLTDAGRSAMPGAGVDEEVFAQEERRTSMRRSLDDIVGDNPEVFARVLKKWLSEG